MPTISFPNVFSWSRYAAAEQANPRKTIASYYHFHFIIQFNAPIHPQNADQLFANIFEWFLDFENPLALFQVLDMELLKW